MPEQRETLPEELTVDLPGGERMLFRRIIGRARARARNRRPWIRGRSCSPLNR